MRRFCGSRSDEQNRQEARVGAAVSAMTHPPPSSPAYMDQMDSWLMNLREMTAEKYNLLCWR